MGVRPDGRVGRKTLPSASAIDAVNSWSFASAATLTGLHHGVFGSRATFFSSKTTTGGTDSLPSAAATERGPPLRTRTVQPFSARVEWNPTRSSALPRRSTFTAPLIVTFFTPPMPFTGNQNCETLRVS